jgi:hypothetical protein
LGASAEGFLECLADLGVDDVHAPIGGRPLSVVVSPEGLPLGAWRISGWISAATMSKARST